MILRFVYFALVCLVTTLPAIGQTTRLPEDRKSRQLDGLYENRPGLVALTGALVTRHPDDEPTYETVLIRNKTIEAVGARLEVPEGTRIVDATGLHIFAGFIDAYDEIEVPFDKEIGTPYWNDQIRPQLRVGASFKAADLKTESKRKSGITTALFAPKDGVMQGQSALFLMLDDDADAEDLLMKTGFAQHFHLTVPRSRRSRSYPNSPMGAVALARQTFYDTQWFMRSIEKKNSEKIERNDALVALASLMVSDQRAIFKTSNELFNLRADRFASEFDLKNVMMLGNGHEYRRIDAIAETKWPILLPVNFPAPPEVGTPELAADVGLETLMHWEHAPKNPAVLAAAGIPFCFTTLGLQEDDQFLDKVRTAVKHGLSESQALAALTTSSAELIGLGDSVGKIEPGFLANLVITDKPIFEDDAEIVQTWVAGRQFEVEDSKPEPVVWELRNDDPRFAGVKLQTGKDNKVIKQPDTQVKLQHSMVTTSIISGSFKADDFGTEGWAQLSLTLTSPEKGFGSILLADGTSIDTQITKTNEAPFQDKSDADEDGEDNDEENRPNQDKDAANVKALSKVNYPFGYAGVETPPEDPGSVLVKNVTLWTCSADGVIEDAAILVADGKIKSVFKSGVSLPTADLIIDGEGAHLTPGVIDCHSHMASDSGINESGQAITAEVRIGDMIDCDDITIYRQLAGGVTVANILHGSANPIGGQNQVIKLRWGALDEEMKFKAAPQGIKFALGENVKQSNWENPTNRYPQTRMGVEQIYENAFEEATLYRAKQKAFNDDRQGIAPRVNLELEAIAEIMEGKRWIHCHSYRQDEILTLLRLLERRKIQIGTFQHILEGYKVADALAAHGAMGSAFSDWWAYKYEVKDAIPFAGALMHRQGVVMSFNSDDAELGRQLNREAAKAVRYGGLDFEEALNFVTINPAKQLRIDDRVGSIEPGKDADFVLWSAHPLSNFAVAEQTWIDGRKYFDRFNDQKRHEMFMDLKRQLIQKVLRSGEDMQPSGAESTDPAKFWPRYDAFCGHAHHEDHDDDHASHDHDEHNHDNGGQAHE